MSVHYFDRWHEA